MPGIVFLIVDGLNLIRRIYAGTPGEGAGHFEAALTATVQSLRRALFEFSPTHAVVVFDSEGPTWRHELYPEYKAGRKPMPEELRAGLDRYRQAFSDLGVSSVSKPGVEADDVVATLASVVTAHGGKAIILSTDTAFCQLLSERISVRDHFENGLGRLGHKAKHGDRQHDVERAIIEGQILGSSPSNGNGKPVLRGARLGCIEHRLLEVEPGDDGAVLGSVDRIRAVAGAHVEHALARELPGEREDHLRLDPLRNAPELARAPPSVGLSGDGGIVRHLRCSIAAFGRVIPPPDLVTNRAPRESCSSLSHPALPLRAKHP